MKKILVAALVIALAVISLAGCTEKSKGNETIQGNLKTYCKLEDGTWSCDGITYLYRLEIKGRLHSAVCDSVYVYLSNIPEISFEQAYKAGGLSSNSEDYFSIGEALLVEIRTE